MHPIQGPQVRNTFAGRHAGLVLFILAILALLLLALISRPAAAASEARSKILDGGKQEYTEFCVSCHGADGKGGGPLAAKLVKPPKDLTAIAASNGGVFPFWIVFDMVAGETPVAGHDTHQMPEYYATMKAQDFKPGYPPAPLRLLSLVHYLESIQSLK
jgi:mono/diheme cytochrome c family protein